MSIKEGHKDRKSSFHVVPQIDPKKLPFEVIQILNATNLLFEECTGIKELFRLKPEALVQILKPWEGDKDFPFKIGSLAMFFDTDLEPLRNLLESPEQEWRSIMLVMKWLELEGQDSKMIKTWKDISDIRNATVPMHEPKSSLVKLYNSYGQTLPHVDFQELWITILEQFLASLERFCQFLNGKIYPQP